MEIQETVSRRVIGAAIEVHRTLGPGFLEAVYEEALCLGMTAQGIPFIRQHPVAVFYKGHAVGETRLDMLVDAQLIVELKAVDTLSAIHSAQLLSYLKATKLRTGLLINFNVKFLADGIRRLVL